MHPTAIYNCQQFFDVYAENFPTNSAKIVEIGSQDINGSLRSCAPSHLEYVGVDFVNGKGVDVVLDDPYKLPFASDSIDIALSSSCFEHSEMFWLLFLEIMRILKPGGLFYLNAPSNGNFHRYPVDCWRFYPDSGKALISWAKHNGINAALLESYTSMQIDEHWNDYVAIYIKEESLAARYPKRILHTKRDFYNGTVLGSDNYLNHSEMPEDRLKLTTIKQIIDNQIKTTVQR